MLLGTFGLERGGKAGAATSCASPKARQNTRLHLRPRTPVCERARWWGRAAAVVGGVKRCVLTRVLTRS